MVFVGKYFRIVSLMLLPFDFFFTFLKQSNHLSMMLKNECTCTCVIYNLSIYQCNKNMVGMFGSKTKNYKEF